MKCDICGQEFDEYDDIYTFTTQNGNEVNVCEWCIRKRTQEVEKAVAKVNVN